jgi:peroxin-12
MAERGAFLTSTTISRPSVFEVLAQDNLAITIHPALKRVANVCFDSFIENSTNTPVQFLATTNPRIYGWILEWFDEIYLIFNYCVQTHYLRNYSE